MESNNFEEARMNFLDEAEKLLQQNMLPQALNLAEERLRSLPVDVDAYVIAGNALIGMGRVNEARDILREVEEIISGLSLIYDRMGDIYRKKGFHQDAAICYEKFIALNPNAEKAREVIEKMALLEQEDRPVAEVDMPGDNGILKPDFFTVTLAELYIRQGHLQVAAGILKEIIKREPQNLQAVAKLDTVKTAIALKSSARGDVVRSNHLAETLTRWLENIDRLKKHAAEK
ncbi:MAG: tetratricopeptide repeat protein [Bacteroidetes bacterium]|nr:tetratricopeptide repeat protein [Bacteroidota bacterium]